MAYAWRALHDSPPPPELECGPATAENAQAEPDDSDEGRKRKRAAERWRRGAGQRARRAVPFVVNRRRAALAAPDSP